MAVSFTGPALTFTSVTSHSPDAATFAKVSLTLTRFSVALSLVVPRTISWLPSLRTWVMTVIGGSLSMGVS